MSNPPTPAADRTTPAAPSAALSPAALDFTMNRIDGTPVSLAEHYAGKVVLIVNVASKCGYTPQYAGLQQLHERYHEQGLAILGFPANEFGNQEPGTNEEIAAFCQENFGVTFDMFEKVVVKGEGIHPLFAHLTSEEATRHSRADARPESGEIRWNFEKFLLDRSGRLVNRFGTRTDPGAAEMVEAIEAALAE